jgi:pimeloyl-ACP methyl ester carboxylesterase
MHPVIKGEPTVMEQDPERIVRLLTGRASRRRFLTGIAAGLTLPTAGISVPTIANVTKNQGEAIVARQSDEAVSTGFLTVLGARLYYEVSGSGPVLLLIHGAPADAHAFAPIVSLLEEHYTVVRYDTRGISRSHLDSPAEDISVAVHADDARRILAKFGDERAAVLGSSGGAVIGLALTECYPEQVSTLVAHEPPLVQLLPEEDARRTAVQEIDDTYRREGVGPAMEKFIVLAGGQSEPEPPSQVTPEMQAAMARFHQNLDTLFALYLLPITTYIPDVAAMQAGPSRVVVGVGEASAGELAHDTALALAERLGTEAVTFPGGHGGYTSHPGEFIQKLHEVLRTS